MSNPTTRVVVITGASAGIGAALGRVLATRGSIPVLVARRKDKLEEVASGLPGERLTVVADVTRREDVHKARDATLARFGKIDVWINNAGRGISRQVSELTDDDFDEMMLVNVKSALYGMQAVLPHFKERGIGHIINVSSMLGRVPFAAVRSAYSASKHALNSLTANLRMELRTEFPKISVTAVHPGVVATDFGLNARHGGVDSRRIPNAQSVEEVAEVIAKVIDEPKADVYTRPGAQQLVSGYYAAEDMGQVELRPPFVVPTSAPQ